MNNINEIYQKNLLNAWSKICQWTKKNCAGKFPKGKRFYAPHNPYVWFALVINSEGEARIYRGNHSSDKPSYVLTEFNVYGVSFNNGLYGNDHKEEDFQCASKFGVNIIFDELEDVIRMWETFKNKILSEVKWSDSISTFEP